MSELDNFTYVEFAPYTGDPEIVGQAIQLMHSIIWHRESMDPAKIDAERAKQIVAAVSPSGQVVAAAAMEMFPPVYFYVTELATAPEYRRTYKFGSTLLGMLEATAKSMGAEDILLSALPKSREFFEKLGYQPDSAPSSTTYGLMKKF